MSANRRTVRHHFPGGDWLISCDRSEAGWPPWSVLVPEEYLVGLVPPLALGALVNALVERKDTAEGALLAGLVGWPSSLRPSPMLLSDGLYARNAGRLYRTLRLQMFEGASRRPLIDEEERSGLPSRFISDAETVGVMVSVLDSGSMQIVEFGSAVVVLGLLVTVDHPYRRS